MAKNWLHHKPIIGLIGGIGSGKSTVAQMFAEEGFGVIDSDVLAQSALEEPVVIEQLQSWWGDRVVTEAGGIDRQAVGQIVFSDENQLNRLEGLTHPRVHAGRRQMRAQLLADPDVRGIIEDTPLLIEAGLTDDVDILIYVDAPREQRLARVKNRGWDAEELDRREKNQTPLDNKAARADYVISNDASEQETYSHVRGVISEIFQ